MEIWLSINALKTIHGGCVGVDSCPKAVGGNLSLCLSGWHIGLIIRTTCCESRPCSACERSALRLLNSSNKLSEMGSLYCIVFSRLDVLVRWHTSLHSYVHAGHTPLDALRSHNNHPSHSSSTSPPHPSFTHGTYLLSSKNPRIRHPITSVRAAAFRTLYSCSNHTWCARSVRTRLRRLAS